MKVSEQKKTRALRRALCLALAGTLAFTPTGVSAARYGEGVTASAVSNVLAEYTTAERAGTEGLIKGVKASDAAAGQMEGVAAALDDLADYLQRTVADPQISSTGGDWVVFGLARSGRTVPAEYYQRYYQRVCDAVRACDGVLSTNKYTEYSRVALTLTALGKDPRDVAGYDLLAPLGDYEKTVWQGINGPIWALLALDSGRYDMPAAPEGSVQATRERYVNAILQAELPQGGFSLSGKGEADADVTAMALQALAGYRKLDGVEETIDRSLSVLSASQRADGGFDSWGAGNSESVSQVIVALCALDIPLDDPRFVKEAGLVENLLSYYRPGEGIWHAGGGTGDDQMATEQGFYALVAAERAQRGAPFLYDISDPLSLPGEGELPSEGLPGKHPDVTRQPVKEPGKTFSDIAGEPPHPNREAIEGLAARGIVGGKTETEFVPDGQMTRAEFATIVVRALGLKPEVGNRFTDVTPEKWYAPFVGTASAYGIVNGDSETTFHPEGTITRQEAATMVARAAALCGWDTERTQEAVQNILSQFDDYLDTAVWARSSLAFCYEVGILDDAELVIGPDVPVLRCEIAQMLWNLLGLSNLL